MKPIRPIRIDGEIARVSLTRGYEAIIDVADLPLVEGFSWYSQIKRRRDGSIRGVYAVRSCRAGPKMRVIMMHRVIAGTPDGLETDHEDGNTLNNRRANLRHASTAQNQVNRKLQFNNTSGVKGVSWDPQRRKWRAMIAIDGRDRILGRFRTIEEAASTYSAASTKLHGEFGRTA